MRAEAAAHGRQGGSAAVGRSRQPVIIVTALTLHTLLGVSAPNKPLRLLCKSSGRASSLACRRSDPVAAASQLAQVLRLDDSQAQSLLGQCTGLRRQGNGLLQRIGRFARPGTAANLRPGAGSSPQHNKEGIAKDWVQFLMEEADGKENAGKNGVQAEDSMEGAPASMRVADGSPQATGSTPDNASGAQASLPA